MAIKIRNKKSSNDFQLDKDDWLNMALPLYERLTPAVITIIQSVLKVNNVEYLAITGRTKDQSSALEKVKRKGYSDPDKQMTDISGIRIVLFFESDVKLVSKLIENTFSVDAENSLDQDEVLSVNQTGYRSVHFVCDLGVDRSSLPEFNGLANLKFEIQVRTVLQHAWAVLSHDKNYKFSGKLPRELERQLYLYAGLLEIADKGFDELSSRIDNYALSIEKKSNQEKLNSELDSISLRQFIHNWAAENGLAVEDKPNSDNYLELIEELNQFDIKTIGELNSIIPKDFADKTKRLEKNLNVYAFIRVLMLMHDWKRLHREVKRSWTISSPDDPTLKTYFNNAELSEMSEAFRSSSRTKGSRHKVERDSEDKGD